MNIFLYIFRTIFRAKWWLILLPIVLTIIAIYSTRNMDRQYETDLTIYTGVISGYGSDPGETSALQDWNVLNNAIQNIINTLNSKETLKRLSLHLYARCMIHGDPDTDNLYILAKHYRELLAITPTAVRELIDKSSEENTVVNLQNYERADRDNFVYGLFNWNHPYFSYRILKENIKIRRIDNSDILQLSYRTNDPGVAFQTLEILSVIYPEEYKMLQYGRTNNIIKYFETELARIGNELSGQEDSLTIYNVENRVINYDKQTEAITLLDKEYELRHQDVLMAYSRSQSAIQQLELGMDANMRAIKNNTEFLDQMRQISDLNYSISKLRTVNIDSISPSQVGNMAQLNSNLNEREKELRSFMDTYTSQKYTKDGYPNANYVSQWVDELLTFSKAEAELLVIRNFKKDLDDLYTHFSPIGSVLKRKERSISFSEQSYLSILSSLNAARLRLKSLEMNSASLKIINPATFPLNALPNSRRPIIAGVFFGSILFILGIIFLLELFNRTLRDKMRSERITRGNVLAAFPAPSKDRYHEMIEQRAIHVLANQLYTYYDPNKETNIVNVIKLSPKLEISKVTALLHEHWSAIGLRTQAYYEGTDFQVQSRSYLVEQDWLDETRQYDISIIQHASIATDPVPKAFLEKGMATVLVLSADSVWESGDKLLFNNLVERSLGKPVIICLTNAEKSVVQEFTGLLPPFTFLRRLEHRLSHFGSHP